MVALPRFRRQAIGTRLMDEAKRKVSERSDAAGIEVGMSPDDTEMRSSNDAPVLYLTKTPAERPWPESSPSL